MRDLEDGKLLSLHWAPTSSSQRHGGPNKLRSQSFQKFLQGFIFLGQELSFLFVAFC